jgi:GWxTD domain-containing protein
MKRFDVILLLMILVACFFSCYTPVNIEQDPFYESFYEKARLIMTKEEIEIYKRLPDRESREEFIAEFWRIRDPDTSTEKNENKAEFEKRIEYANRWFGWRNPDKGRLKPEEQEKYRGWDTERGRIYIVLGDPDSLIYDRSALMNHGRKISSPEGRGEETWGYWRYRLYVTFRKGGLGRWHVAEPEPDLFHFLEAAKLNLLEPGSREEAKRRLTFEADFDGKNIRISIPLARMNLMEKDGWFVSELAIEVNVYRDHKKVDRIEKIESIRWTEDQVLQREKVRIELPFDPQQSGEYLLDIIVEDKLAVAFPKYRNYVRFKND